VSGPLLLTKLAHASLRISGSAGSIVTDPWFAGRVFADSWAHSELPHSSALDALVECAYIWVSHGHPDHFSPPTLLSVPEERRSRITALILETRPNQELIGWFRRNGFSVQLLKHHRRLELQPGLFVESGEVHFGDSWLWLSIDGWSILNVNDCVLGNSELRYLRRRFKDVDVLAIQYGVANWTGNPEDEVRRATAARSVLDRVERVVGKICPKFVLPFASEFRFCHEENAYLNSSQNSVEDVEQLMAHRKQKCLVLENGDSVDRDWLITRNREVAQLETGTHRSVGHVQLGDLQRLYRNRLRETGEYHGRFRMFVYRKLIGWFPFGKIVVDVSDLGQRLTISSSRLVNSLPHEATDIRMSSEMLAEVVAKPYGLDNLFIGGRFRRSDDSALLKLGLIFGPDRLRSMGLHMGPSLFLRPRLLSALFGRLVSGRWSSRSR